MKTQSIMEICIGMAFLCVGCSPPNTITNVTIEKWEHGLKTQHIKATVMHSTDFGENIQFTFPRKEQQCDRIEILNYIEGNGGHVITGGGYPGAPIFAVFDGVTNRDTAYLKLNQVLPAFEVVAEKL